ncbi:MAG TPA: hypothetical protein VMS89_03150 [Methanoregulaceae archaeon]|nr:hypothetical protein [Methanoregulaceae archaeon]
MGVNEVAGRWKRASRHMREEDAELAEQIVMFAKQFSSEAFYAFDDPIEAALFSVIISMVREQEWAAMQGPDDTACRTMENDSREA